LSERQRQSWVITPAKGLLAALVEKGVIKGGVSHGESLGASAHRLRSPDS